MFVTPRRSRIAAFLFAVSAPAPVFAYMGPGIGVGALGAALGVVASLLLFLCVSAALGAVTTPSMDGGSTSGVHARTL